MYVLFWVVSFCVQCRNSVCFFLNVLILNDVIFTVDVHFLTANDSTKTYTLYYDEWKNNKYINVCIYAYVIRSSVFWQQAFGWIDNAHTLVGWISIDISLTLYIHTSGSLWLICLINDFQRATTYDRHFKILSQSVDSLSNH